MSGPVIDEVLSTETPISRVVTGAEIMQHGMKGFQPVASAQVLRVEAAGDFRVDLEAALVAASGAMTFVPIGSFDQKAVTADDESNLSTFRVSSKVLFRFRHVSGEDCRCLLSG